MRPSAEARGVVLGDWWYYIPWAKCINASGWRFGRTKVGRKLYSLILVGPLVVVFAVHQVCRGRTLQVWVDNAWSIEVYSKDTVLPELPALHNPSQGDGHSGRRHQVSVRSTQITRCKGMDATLACQLSKVNLVIFRKQPGRKGGRYSFGQPPFKRCC